MRWVAMAMMWMAAACCFAGESAYGISLDFSADGEHVASREIVVVNGVKSSVELDGRFIDVMAKEAPGEERVMVSFWIGEVEGGVRRLLATPSAVAKLGTRVVLKVMVEGSGMREVALGVMVSERSSASSGEQK